MTTPQSDSSLVCGTCRGDGESRLRWEEPCPDCSGTGRATPDSDSGLEGLPFIDARTMGAEHLTERCIVVWSDHAELFDPNPNAQRWTRLRIELAEDS